MKKTLLIFAIFPVVIFAACGKLSQTATQPATTTPAASQTATPPAPTETPTPFSATETSVPEPTEAAVVSVSFANDVMPIFQTSCVECHGVRQVKEGLDLQTYETLLAGSFNGAVIIPGNASESLLIQLVIEGEMPNRGPKLTAEQIQIISDWIDAGAPNN